MEKQRNPEIKNLFIGVGIIFLYLILSSLAYDFIAMFGINYNSLSFIRKQIYLILYEFGITTIIFYIYRKDVIKNFNDYKNNILGNIKKYIKYWFLMMILMFISNYIVTLFTTTDVSNNQQIILVQLKSAPIYTFITTVLIAPILEELVFRVSLKKIFHHTKFLLIFFSGVLFGFMHVISSLESLVDLLFIIPYSIPGFVFAYLYSKTDNICIPISLHMIHNFIMLSIQIILLIK